MGLPKTAIKIIVIPIVIIFVLAVLAAVLIKITRRRSKPKHIQAGEFPPPAPLQPPGHAIPQPQTAQFAPMRGGNNNGSL
ncbi:hypothetical protein EsDP_00002932 [Epichloe bromicola]|uniref:Uncharacterized protein n=1 Tax=Epichloe bromicola TaxID=79588 RepID=A0ABQ0CM88_9HYPO